MAKKNPSPRSGEQAVHQQLQVAAMATRVLKGIVPHVPHRNLLRFLSDHILDPDSECARGLVEENLLRGEVMQVASECKRLLEVGGQDKNTRHSLEVLQGKAERMAQYDFAGRVRGHWAREELARITAAGSVAT